jgi:hypothetical protein
VTDFPGNTFKDDSTPKTPEEEPKSGPEKVEKPVLQGRATIKRKGLWSRTKDLFAEDGVSFGTQLLEGIVVPMIKDMALQLIQTMGNSLYGSAERAIHRGDSGLHDMRGTYQVRGPIGNHHSYNGYHASAKPPIGSRTNPIVAQPYGQQPAYYKPQPMAMRRTSNRLVDVFFEYRSDASKAKAYIEGVIEEQGFCTVAQYYEIANYPIDHTDNNWGWADIDRAYVQQSGRDGFILNLPDPEPIQVR